VSVSAAIVAMQDRDCLRRVMTEGGLHMLATWLSEAQGGGGRGAAQGGAGAREGEGEGERGQWGESLSSRNKDRDTREKVVSPKGAEKDSSDNSKGRRVIPIFPTQRPLWGGAQGAGAEERGGRRRWRGREKAWSCPCFRRPARPSRWTSEALKTCGVGHSVNQLARSHRNADIQRRAPRLVDTWKKRVADATLSEADCAGTGGAGPLCPALSLWGTTGSPGVSSPVGPSSLGSSPVGPSSLGSPQWAPLLELLPLGEPQAHQGGLPLWAPPLWRPLLWEPQLRLLALGCHWCTGGVLCWGCWGCCPGGTSPETPGDAGEAQQGAAAGAGPGGGRPECQGYAMPCPLSSPLQRQGGGHSGSAQGRPRGGF